ncbi:hypothetical protein GQ42DRAFT_130959 [Ramicandelaber brevisporus]|nr:hypothetical protein GQ42DRAFT_130959 [Ramicandelaber brevisporus]
MGMYMVQSNGLEPSNFGYSVCGDIRGLSGAAERGDIDAFLWENFTTKPYYDSGVLRRLGIVLAPWSSFLIGQRRTSTPATAAAATTAPADLQLQNAIDTFLNVLQESVEQFADPAPQTRAHAIEYLSKRFGYSKADATAWIEGVSYTKTATGRVQLREVDRAVMEKCMSVLKAAGAIDHARSPQDICVQGVLAN